MKKTIQVEEEEEFEREIMVPKVIREDREVKVPVPVMETKTVRVPRQRIITEEEEVRAAPALAAPPLALTLPRIETREPR